MSKSKKGAAAKGSRRDEFSQATKEILAERSAQRCSNPDCRILTKGPRLSEDGKQNAGCAAHITAAAPGGPRYDRSLTSDERRSAANGLWLCRNCGERVDDDVARYPAVLLRKWKADVELEVEQALGKPAPLILAPRPEVSWIVVGGESVDVLTLEFSTPPTIGAKAREKKFCEEELVELGEIDLELRAQGEAFNAEVEAYCSSVAHLECAAMLEERAERDAASFSVELTNHGTEPLRNVRMYISFPEGFVLADSDHPVERPPLQPPPRRPKSLEDALYPSGVLGLLGTMFEPMAPIVVSPVEREFTDLAKHIGAPSWRWGPEVRDGVVQAWLEGLQHTLSYSFEEFVQVIPPQEPGTYQAEVKIIADNLPIAQKGVLELVVVEATGEQ